MRKKLLMVFSALLLLFAGVHAQTVTISGKVTDDKGKPIDGASIVDKKTKQGTSTDADGKFKLNLKEGSVIQISSVGFAKREMTVRANENLNITLVPENEDLSEVVVTALGIKREKKALGYAVSTVGSKDLEARPEGGYRQGVKRKGTWCKYSQYQWLKW